LTRTELLYLKFLVDLSQSTDYGRLIYFDLLWFLVQQRIEGLPSLKTLELGVEFDRGSLLGILYLALVHNLGISELHFIVLSQFAHHAHHAFSAVLTDFSSAVLADADLLYLAVMFFICANLDPLWGLRHLFFLSKYTAHLNN